MDTTQLVYSVIIAVIALLSKEIILWLMRLSHPIIRKLIKPLRPTVVNCIARYWRILIDLCVLVLISFMIRPVLSSATSASRSEIFQIAFWTAWLVYWLAQLLTDIIQKMNKQNHTQQNIQPDRE